MTVQELYIFACKHDLFNEEVSQVIEEFNKKSTVFTQSVESSRKFNLSKIEYTYQDVIDLLNC